MKRDQAGRLPGEPDFWLSRQTPRLVRTVSRLLGPLYDKSLRWRVRDNRELQKASSERGALVCAWHGDLAASVLGGRHDNLLAMVSPHWIGELIVQAIEPLGYRTIRASRWLRPLSGMREVLRALKRGERVVVILDGPSGPRRQLNADVISVASHTGAPLVPVIGAGYPSIKFPSWDRSEWPLPFARASFRYGEPIHVPPAIDNNQRDHYQHLLVHALSNLEKKVRGDISPD
jgi:lysophospholipid acyltransferase (LPLAT)-like uncharacterized protein